jgi:hypothetical protein
MNRPLLGPRDPDIEGHRTWNGVFPSVRQLLILASWLVTPVRSEKYGSRYNAWRVATAREPLTEHDIAEIRRWFGVRDAR